MDFKYSETDEICLGCGKKKRFAVIRKCLGGQQIQWVPEGKLFEANDVGVVVEICPTKGCVGQKCGDGKYFGFSKDELETALNEAEKRRRMAQDLEYQRGLIELSKRHS